ncbi:hypothetical protein PO909_025377 [Leuciscus waleckii]
MWLRTKTNAEGGWCQTELQGLRARVQVHGNRQARSNPGGAGRLRERGDVAGLMVDGGAEEGRSGGGGVMMTGQGGVVGTAVGGRAKESPSLFRTLAAECKWNEEAQWDMFLHGLADRVQKEIYTLELPKTLDELVELELRVDARLQQRENRPYPTPVVDFTEFPSLRGVNTVSPSNDPEPMQVGRARLSPEEREHRHSRGLCLYCGEAGHFISTCPLKGQARR